jgi:MarR family transcriptional regulator for hemolysin
MPHRSQNREILFTISDVGRLLRTYADQKARRFGQTRAQWAVLLRLERREGLKQSDLAEDLDIQPITLTRLVDRLCDNGLIERRSMKRKRQRNLALFALGLDLGIEMAEQADLAFIAEANEVAGRELLRRLDQRLPARTIKPLDQRRLDLGLGLAADAAAFELG